MNYSALALLLPLAVMPLQAQSGALPVTVSGTILDRSYPPAAAPLAVNESYSSGTGPSLVIDPDGGYIYLYSNDPNSTLFTTFQVPGALTKVGNIAVPRNAFFFSYATPPDANGSSITVAGDFQAMSGLIHISGNNGTSFLYDGSLNNPLLLNDLTQPDDVQMNLAAYLWKWPDVASLGGGDAGDSTACQALPKAVTVSSHAWVALIQRGGGCNFSTKIGNAARAGATGAIIYNNASLGEDLGFMLTPFVPIPGFLIGADDGAALAAQTTSGTTKIEIDPTNLAGNISGTYTVAADGTLQDVNLNLYVADVNNHIFFGTVTGAGSPAQLPANAGKVRRPAKSRSGNAGVER